MPDSAATDHELILLIRHDLSQMRSQLSTALGQLERGNTRFEQIALNEQAMQLAISELRQNFSRAMLHAEEAKRRADQAQDALDQWQTRLRTLVLIGAPVLTIISALLVEGLKRLVFP